MGLKIKYNEQVGIKMSRTKDNRQRDEQKRKKFWIRIHNNWKNGGKWLLWSNY